MSAYSLYLTLSSEILTSARYLLISAYYFKKVIRDIGVEARDSHLLRHYNCFCPF